MMNISIENKAKFFAQYWGQRVLSDLTNGGDRILCPIEASNMYRIEESHLKLKSLESITDEDVLKIAELLLWQRNILESSMIAQTKEILLSISKITTVKGWEWANIIDKVRELGYAYWWNGISVKDQIECGFIKLKS
ncbi:hypothetical protein DRF62_02215 [Chryseobacterium piscium]|uniref:Uncharacterized protein n=1 Tax=Chryseobacterium piscium TaxID=333702 RepID=A0A3D9BTZ6_9FLAO|nr:hypothetical protein [Chryseobacterium piscium]REC56995.1 hypothetical protein DRF62_02215 [Chryseobacterium piscium]